MGEQNRKNTKSEKSPGNVSKSAVKKADKEKMKELAQKKIMITLRRLSMKRQSW